MAKILVIDDSKTERSVLKALLGDHEVIEAETGDEGIGLARQHGPDLILLDVVMPGKNGFETCRELRKEHGMESVPIIMLSAKDQPTDKQWGMRQGATEYLTKPFRDEELLTVVKQYV